MGTKDHLERFCKEKCQSNFKKETDCKEVIEELLDTRVSCYFISEKLLMKIEVKELLGKSIDQEHTELVWEVMEPGTRYIYPGLMLMLKI
jgi:hypothetical protein